MKLRQLIIIAASAFALIFSSIAAAEQTTTTFTDAQQKEMGKIIHQYLLNNPEVLVEASQALQKAEQTKRTEKAQKAISDNTKELINANSPFVGNPKGDVVIVEFLDYQCGHCKRMVSVIDDIVAKDSNVKVVFKGFPIFGANSEFAAKSSLAAMKQGKFFEFHNALLGEKGKLTNDKIMAIATKMKLDVEQMKKDIESSEFDDHLKANFKLGEAIGIRGTPAFVVVGNPNTDKMKSFFVPGATSTTALQKLIKDARSTN